jgi:hypothetical protein
MFGNTPKPVCRALALAFVALLPLVMTAQSVSTVTGAHMADTPAKWDISLGYSFLAPEGTFYPIQPSGSVLPVQFKTLKNGTIVGGAYYFRKNLGMQVETGEHDLWTNSGFDENQGASNGGVFTVQDGLIYRFPGGGFTPFAHALGGFSLVHGPDHEPYTWGPALTIGGGLDLDTRWLKHRLSIRLFQVDYEFFHANSGTSHFISNGNFVWGDNETANGMRYSAGLVYHFNTWPRLKLRRAKHRPETSGQPQSHS